MPIPPEQEMRVRIEALERENAAIKAAMREVLGGMRPGPGLPNPFNLRDVAKAQAVWDALFGAEGGA